MAKRGPKAIANELRREARRLLAIADELDPPAKPPDGAGSVRLSRKRVEEMARRAGVRLKE